METKLTMKKKIYIYIHPTYTPIKKKRSFPTHLHAFISTNQGKVSHPLGMGHALMCCHSSARVVLVLPAQVTLKPNRH